MRQQAEYAFRMNGLLAKAGKLRSDWFSQRFHSLIEQIDEEDLLKTLKFSLYFIQKTFQKTRYYPKVVEQTGLAHVHATNWSLDTAFPPICKKIICIIQLL